MKISVNDQELFRLTETQKKVIQHDIPSEIFDEDMRRRIHYILMHKYDQSYRRLSDEWIKPGPDGQSKLQKNGVRSIPTNAEEIAELIFQQPNYRNRSQREQERQ